MRRTLQNEANCCLPLNSVIASEPFKVMEIPRKLREFERELDNVDYEDFPQIYNSMRLRNY